MSHSTRWWSRLAVLAAASAIIFAACNAAATTAPSAAPVTAAPVTAAPYDAMSYPADAPASCDDKAKNASEFKQIKAIDATHVEFDLCQPDVAFLAKIAFASNAIQDSAYLTAHAADKSLLRAPNGTGPYKLTSWDAGNRMVFEANADYWGDPAKTANLEFRWSDQAVTRTQELIAGTVDGIANPSAEDMKTLESHSDLKFYPRQGTNIAFLGMNVLKDPWKDLNVRKAIAMGINRKQLVDNFYPPGSEVATHFTPCLIPFGCEGEEWYDFDPAAAKKLLADAGFPDGFTTTLSFRAAVRGYNPDPPAVATEIAAQLKQNLNITATLDLRESGAMLSDFQNGAYDGLVLIGWGADFPDATNFLDVHFGSGSGGKFGEPFPDIAAALSKGATSASDADRKAAYTEANKLIKEKVPMALLAHGGSGVAFKADVEGAHASPVESEIFSVMKAADRDTLVWMQNAEPLGLYCGDESDGETLRACEQIFESLYAYEVGGTATKPSLATECKPDAALTTWTCTLREGVKFHDGSTLDANDVVLSYAVQWDTKHALHVGNTGDFEYFPGLFAGYLNPPPPS